MEGPPVDLPRPVGQVDPFGRLLTPKNCDKSTKTSAKLWRKEAFLVDAGGVFGFFGTFQPVFFVERPKRDEKF